MKGEKKADATDNSSMIKRAAEASRHMTTAERAAIMSRANESAMKITRNGKTGKINGSKGDK